MTYRAKIAMLMTAINNNIVFPEEQKRIIESSLCEGFMAIVWKEKEEEKAGFQERRASCCT